MRTLLISAGVCLTAGTFVAAERVTSSATKTSALETQAAINAAVDERVALSQNEFKAELAALDKGKKNAQTQVAALQGTLAEITADRDSLAAQVTAEKMSAEAIRETLAELEASRQDLIAEIQAKDATLTEKDAELAALNTQLETVAQGDGVSISDGEGSASESLRVALAEAESLTEKAQKQIKNSDARLVAMRETLRVRDATVSRLQAELTKAVAVEDDTSPTIVAVGTELEEPQSPSRQLAELTALVESQQETISHLRMGFDQKPADTMEMASACIERANKIFEISQIKFATGTSAISDQSITTLDHLRDLAIGCESDEMLIEIGGHTDSLGAETANQTLSEARAQSVREFLIGRGIPEDTMVAVGYGESQPIATNDTQIGRAQNRRITFTWQMRDKATDDIEG